jgi:hypothetical protein
LAGFHAKRPVPGDHRFPEAGAPLWRLGDELKKFWILDLRFWVDIEAALRRQVAKQTRHYERNFGFAILD